VENKLYLSIDGMHCEACVRRVTAALSGVDGVKVESVQVGSAEVAFDSGRVSPSQITAAVDRTGFSAKAGR
jgi:copper chaperone